MRDLEALQGSWEQVGFEENGVADSPDAYGAPGSLTTFHQDRFTVRSAEGVLLLEGRFELNTDTSPRSVNWMDSMGADAGKVLPAIYALTDDDFIFVAAAAGAPRPTEFRTVDGQTLRRFIRRS
jgi:uncharacterized protein (TIGR03067 family)